MAPDLNSLPPSHGQAASASASQESSGADSHNTISPLVTAASNQTGYLRRESSSPPNQPAAPHSSRLRPSGRLNTQETPSPPRVGEASSRRNSQLYLYRTSSQSQRDALSGSALPSPRSPVSASMASQGDPHHQRAPSLGELHQELEQEQEAQVNRLLQMIRQQQAQLQQLQQQNSSGDSASTSGTPAASMSVAVADDNHPFTASSSIGPSPLASATTLPFRSISPGPYDGSRSSSPPPRTPRFRSRRSSQFSTAHGASSHPLSGSIPAPDSVGSDTDAGRNDAAFYVAETHSLARENEMLRARVRGLEQRIRDTGNGASEGSTDTIGSGSLPRTTAAAERKEE